MLETVSEEECVAAGEREERGGRKGEGLGFL